MSTGVNLWDWEFGSSFWLGQKHALLTFVFLTCLFGNYGALNLSPRYHISLANHWRHKLKIPKEKLGLPDSWMMMMPELILALSWRKLWPPMWPYCYCHLQTQYGIMWFEKHFTWQASIQVQWLMPISSSCFRLNHHQTDRLTKF